MNGAEYCADFRRIPIRDIDLQHEICLDKYSGVADYQRERRSVRRVYSAKIDRGKSSVTVATYQGKSAEEVCRAIPSFDLRCDNISQEWRRDVAKYMAVWQVIQSLTSKATESSQPSKYCSGLRHCKFREYPRYNLS
jgi:hypothetical protein